MTISILISNGGSGGGGGGGGVDSSPMEAEDPGFDSW